MFCTHCGKPILDGASFCAFCGKPTLSASDESKEADWEYTFLRRCWKSGKGGKYYLTKGVTEYSVRLDLWGKDESSVMKETQEFIDLGWHPIHPPGPSSYHFTEHTESSDGVKYRRLELHTFLVEFRRPAHERSKLEKEIIGTWQEARDPNVGLINRLDNVFSSRKLEVERRKMEFRNDRVFNYTLRNGRQLEGGIFSESEGRIALIYKRAPTSDTTAIVKDDKLFIKDVDHGFDVEWERVE